MECRTENYETVVLGGGGGDRPQSTVSAPKREIKQFKTAIKHLPITWGWFEISVNLSFLSHKHGPNRPDRSREEIVKISLRIILGSIFFQWA